MKDSMTMRMMLLVLLSLLVASPVDANQQVEAGDLVLMYSAIPSLDLQPDVARQYRLTRSAGRMLLNVALHRRLDDGATTAISGTLRAAATNQAGQRQELRLDEVREGDAIYYLAEVRASDGDTLTFDIEASGDVEGRLLPIGVRFVQPYFVPR